MICHNIIYYIKIIQSPIGLSRVFFCIGIQLSIQKEEKEKFETKIVLENLKFLY